MEKLRSANEAGPKEVSNLKDYVVKKRLNIQYIGTSYQSIMLILRLVER